MAKRNEKGKFISTKPDQLTSMTVKNIEEDTIMEFKNDGYTLDTDECENDKPYDFSSTGYIKLALVPELETIEEYNPNADITEDITDHDTADAIVSDIMDMDLSNDGLEAIEMIQEVLDIEEEENTISVNIDGCSVKYELITIAALIKMPIKTDIAYQRPLVWKELDKCNLIDSILSGFNIGCIYLHGDNALDGKQRINCACMTANGVFTPTDMLEDFDYLNGKIIGQWPKDDIEKFMNYPVLVVRLPAEWEEDKAIEQFIRINKNGRPLTKLQAYRGKISKKLVELDACIKHGCYSCIYTDSKGKEQNTYGKMSKPGMEDMTIKALNILYGDKCFLSNSLIPWFMGFNLHTSHIKELKTKQDMLTKVIQIISKDENGFTVLKRMTKKTNIPLILALLNSNMDSKAVALNLYGFFNSSKANDNQYKKYAELCSAGSADHANIVARLDILASVI